MEAGCAEQRITKPLHLTGYETIMRWRENYNKVESICKESKQKFGPPRMMTVRGSNHMLQTDFAVLFPKWMDLFINTLTHPGACTSPLSRLWTS